MFLVSTRQEIGLKVGYGRTSTLEQKAGLDAQIRDLQTAGCEKIFGEQVSSVATRPQLEAALDFIREGDTLIVTKLDRLARSTGHLLEIADRSSSGGPTCMCSISAWTPVRRPASSCSR